LSRLTALRRQIDRLDSQILQLLNRRAGVAVQVGRLKRRDGRPVYDGEREAAILRRVARLNRGPLPSASVTRIFRGILQVSRRLEAGGR